jgi:hypothetical protein
LGIVSVSVRVIFVGGLGRSGTTLLERLLGELPGVVPLGEVVHLWARGIGGDEPCGCGARFSRCPFWREVGRRAFGGWSAGLAGRVADLRHRVDRTRRIPLLSLFPRRMPALSRRAPARPPLAEYARAYARLYRAAGETAGVSVVVDSSKHASLAFCLSAALDPALGGLSVVHVVRDPRAVAHSWSRQVSRPEDGEPMTRWRPGVAALHWLVQNLAFHLLARRGVPVTRVRYEDLVDRPRETLSGLAARLGLPSDLAFLREAGATLSPAHTVSGNPMRFTVGPLPLTRDDAWRSRLSRRHRRLVTALTWPLSLRYGYRLGPEVPR